MAKRGSGGGGVLLLVTGGILGAIAQYGKELLVIGGVIFAIWVAIKIFSKPHASVPRAAENPADTEQDTRRVRTSIPPREVTRGKATSSDGNRFWSVPSMDGRPLRAPVYFGSGLASVSGAGIEPALVDLALPRDRSVAGSKERYLSYWPSYSGASPQARQAYLNWLMSGMEDPDADIGYVFLYFYGLERRALHDAATSDQAKAELPAVTAEIERLLARYGNSRSFRSYAGTLLDIVTNASVELDLYQQPASPLREGRELTFRHKLALGQCASDQSPLPADWAYCWYRGAPEAILRKPALRCPEQFRELFTVRYKEVFSEGMKLPRNRTMLALERRPASATFGDYAFKGHTLKFDLPDVTVLTAPIKALQEIADAVSDRLDGYSRFVGKNPDSLGTFDAMVELPFALWPVEYRKPFDDARKLVAGSNKPLALPFDKLMTWLPAWQVINKARYQTLCRVLGEIGLGIEPDPRFNGAVPAADSTVVLFADDPESARPAPSPQYGAAALTLHLASCVAIADGEVNDLERGMLSQRLEDLLNLTSSERQRLKAHVRLHLANPPKLTGLKGRLEELTLPQKEAMGEFMALVACADNVADAKEVKVLERIYKLLGLDTKELYSKLHIVATEPVSIRPATTSQGRSIPAPPQRERAADVQLDHDKIAALKRDSDRIAATLATIFAQPPLEPTPELEPATQEPTIEAADVLLGLDPGLSAFLRTLLTRTAWNRIELEELAADRGLMLDGALERINETAYDQFDKPLFEGDDPIELDGQITEEIAACKESASANAMQ